MIWRSIHVHCRIDMKRSGVNRIGSLLSRIPTTPRCVGCCQLSVTPSSLKKVGEEDIMRRMPKYRSKLSTDQASGSTPLVPILSIVLVVILMLLVAVEFEQIGVIDVGTPPRCGCVIEPIVVRQAQIDLFVGLHGFVVAVDGELLSADSATADGNQGEGLVLLGRNDLDPETATIAPTGEWHPVLLIDDLVINRSGFERTGLPEYRDKWDAAQKRLVAAYDFAALRRVARLLTARFPEVHRVQLGAHPQIPLEVVTLAMDALHVDPEAPSQADRVLFQDVVLRVFPRG